MKFEKQITSAVNCCFFSVEPRVALKTQQLLPATKKDVLPSHHQNNVIYQFLCHCDSRYAGHTSQRLEERIKQHIPKLIANPPTPHICQSLPRPGMDTSPRQFHESAIGHHLLDNAQCALHYNKDKFSVLARARTPFHLSAQEATFIKSLNPLLCKQKNSFTPWTSLKLFIGWLFQRFDEVRIMFRRSFNQWQLAFAYLLNPFLLATALTNEISSFLNIIQFGCISTSFWRCPWRVSDDKLWDESLTSRHLKVLYHQTSFQVCFCLLSFLNENRTRSWSRSKNFSFYRTWIIYF